MKRLKALCKRFFTTFGVTVSLGISVLVAIIAVFFMPTGENKLQEFV